MSVVTVKFELCEIELWEIRPRMSDSSLEPKATPSPKSAWSMTKLICCGVVVVSVIISNAIVEVQVTGDQRQQPTPPSP